MVLLTPIGVVLGLIFKIRFGRTELALASWLLGGSLTVISIWVWIYFRGGAFHLVTQVTHAIWIVSVGGCLFHMFRKFRITLPRSQVAACLAAITSFSLVAGSFYLVPRTLEGQITQRQFIGPDAIGYANAVAGLMEDGSFEELRNVAIASSGHGAEYELFDQDILAVYMIPDKSLSIKTEFIVGSLRIGFPGIVALVTEQLGFRHLLTTMNVTAALFLVIGAVLIYGLMRSRQYSGVLSVIVSVLAMTNISLLVGFHEGGVAQAFMFSATAAFLAASTQGDLTQRTRIFLYIAAYIQVISSYIDMVFVFLGVTVIWWIISSVLKDHNSLHRAKLSLVGAGVSAIALAPLSSKLPRFLLRRLADARQGGWNWGSWTELTGMLGISNPYYDRSPDSIVAQVVLFAMLVVVVNRWTQLPKHKDIQQVRVFTSAVATFAALFYVYSRVIMDHTTYQWFKLVGTFLGPSSIPLIALIIPWNAFKLQKSNLKLLLVAVSVAVLSLTVSYRFARFYFGSSLYLSNSLISEISDRKVRTVTKKYQVFGVCGWQELALTPFWPALCLDRYDGGIRPIARPDLPVGLLVRESDCRQWECLRDVAEANKIPIGDQYLIVDLALTGAEVRDVSPYIQWIRVNRALVKLGAPYVDGNWTHFGPELQFER